LRPSRAFQNRLCARFFTPRRRTRAWTRSTPCGTTSRSRVSGQERSEAPRHQATRLAPQGAPPSSEVFLTSSTPIKDSPKTAWASQYRNGCNPMLLSRCRNTPSERVSSVRHSPTGVGSRVRAYGFPRAGRSTPRRNALPIPSPVIRGGFFSNSFAQAVDRLHSLDGFTCAFAPASVGAFSSGVSMAAFCFFSPLHGLSTGDNTQ
jgi:hypothetical protein